MILVRRSSNRKTTNIQLSNLLTTALKRITEKDRHRKLSKTMSSISPKQGRLTNDIHLESIGNGLTAGFRAGWEACIRASQARIARHLGDPKTVSDWDWEDKNELPEGEEGLEEFNASKMMESFVEGLDLWTMDPREVKEIAEKKPRKKKSAEDEAEEKPKSAKKSSGAWVDDPELAKKPYDPEFCSCRKWNKGFGAQCNRPVAEDGLCSMHKKQYDKIIENGGQDLSHGRYNEERPEKCLAKPEKEHVHPWKDLVKSKDEDTDEKKKVKKEKKATKEKKEKKGKKEKKEKKEKKKEKKVKAKKEEEAEKVDVQEQPNAGQVAEAAAEIVEHVIEEAVKGAVVAAAGEVEHVIEEAVKDVVGQVQDNHDEDEEKTQELEDDDEEKDLSEDSTELKEIDYKGQTYLLNTATKDVIDADDGEKVGTATLDEEGEVQKIDFEGDDEEDSDDDSDDESDDSDDEE